MKKFPLVLAILFMICGLQAAIVFAQNKGSAGCAGITGAYTQTPINFGPAEFYAGDEITIGYDGVGNLAIGVNGMDVATITPLQIYTYQIPSTGQYSFQAVNVNSIANSYVKIYCTPSDGDIPDYPPGTICHYPPGNPDASHTIVVGQNAIQSHIEKHGDTEGPCPDGKDTRVDEPEHNIVVYVLPSTGTIEIYTDCNATECESSTVVVVEQLVTFSQLLDENGHFILYDQAIPFEVSGTGIVLYYLHPHPDDPFIAVFQLNITHGDGLIDDILIFIEADGLILKWANHSIWYTD